jgi:hypothetical protein
MSDDNVEPDTPVAGTAGAALKAVFRGKFNLQVYKIVNDAGQIEDGKYPVQQGKSSTRCFGLSRERPNSLPIGNAKWLPK